VVSPRLLLLVLLASFVAVVAGCGEKEEAYKEAKSEGLYLRAGGLKYQIQLSRTLNPRMAPDNEFLRGLPRSEKLPGKDEEWFGVWLRVENDSDKPHFAARRFEITDSLDKVYEPVAIKTAENPHAYIPGRHLSPRQLMPDPQSLVGQTGIRGAFLLFKLNLSAYQNRPLEFVIKPPIDREAKTELDL
jgi:hypothetical protein